MFSVLRTQILAGSQRYSRNYSIYSKAYAALKPTLNLKTGIDYKNCLGTQNFIFGSNTRTYSSIPSDKEPKKDECTPKRPQECLPQNDCNKNQLPYLQECARPNLMSDSPKPECRIDDRKDNKNIMLLALLGLAASIAALMYFMGKNETRVIVPKKKVIIKENQGTSKPCKIIIKDPQQSADIPNRVPYLLIGGGTAAFSAFRAIKVSEPTAAVLLISNEDHYPYMRPPLSKELWFSDAQPETFDFKQWSGTSRSIFYEPKDFYISCPDLMVSDNGGVAIARGWNVAKLDVNNKKAILEDGYEISFEKALIATGSLPRNLEIFERADDCVKDKVTVFKTTKDYQCVLERIKTANCVTVVGGGFLGSELACALAKRAQENEDFKVIQLFRENGILSAILPQYLSTWTTEKVQGEGVDVHANTEIIGVTGCDKSVTLKLSNGKHITADLVIVAVGSEPDTGLAKGSCLEVDPDLGGYIVNAELQARSNVYVAGDAACFYDTCFGRRRIEHHDNAVVTGRLAGENMAGAAKAYTHQSMFWSDIGSEVSFEALGVVHSSLPTVGVFAKALLPEVTEAPKLPEPAEGDSKVPKECLPYLPKEEEERIRKEDAEKLERKHLADEELRKAEERKKAIEKARNQQYNKGVIFYLKDDVVVGILLWNVFNKLSIARQVLKEQYKYDQLNEVAKLFKIHEEEQ